MQGSPRRGSAKRPRYRAAPVTFRPAVRLVTFLVPGIRVAAIAVAGSVTGHLSVQDGRATVKAVVSVSSGMTKRSIQTIGLCTLAVLLVGCVKQAPVPVASSQPIPPVSVPSSQSIPPALPAKTSVSSPAATTAATSAGFQAPVCGGPPTVKRATPPAIEMTVEQRPGGVNGQYRISARAINKAGTRPLVQLAQLLLVNNGEIIAIASNISPVGYPAITLKETSYTLIDTITPPTFRTCDGMSAAPPGSYQLYAEVFAGQLNADTDMPTTASTVDAVVSGPMTITVKG